MTISSTSRSQQYVGNASTQSFSTVFPFTLATDVQVYKKQTAATVWNLLNYGSDWSITSGGNGSPGTVFLSVIPTGSESILIVRTVPLTQLLNLVANDTFGAESVETALDKAVEGLQQLDARIAAIEASLGVTFIVSEPYIFANNAILCLKNTVTQNASIPSGFNGLAIEPTISPGVVVSIAPGSVLVTLDNSLGMGSGGGPFATLVANTFTGRQDWGTAGANYIMRADPAYGDIYVLKNAATALPINAFTGEFNAFAGELQEQVGTDAIVPLHGIGVSKLTHNGVVTGAETIARNLSDKTGAGLGAQLYGTLAVAQNEVFNHTSGANAGLYLDFRNRSFASGTPINGTPGAGQGYGKNFSAVLIDCLTGRGTVTGITCGWQTGIMFTKGSLDQIQGGATKAVGIDMTAFDLGNLGPEGTPYGARIAACIALPTGTFGSTIIPGITWDTAKTIQTYFASGIGWHVSNAGVMRFAVGTGNGVLYANGGGATSYTNYLDLTGQSQYVMNLNGAGGKFYGAVPSVPGSIGAWLKLRIDAADCFIPIYF
jgi:hypothetical protein